MIIEGCLISLSWRYLKRLVDFSEEVYMQEVLSWVGGFTLVMPAFLSVAFSVRKLVESGKIKSGQWCREELESCRTMLDLKFNSSHTFSSDEVKEILNGIGSEDGFDTDLFADSYHEMRKKSKVVYKLND